MTKCLRLAESFDIGFIARLLIAVVLSSIVMVRLRGEKIRTPCMEGQLFYKPEDVCIWYGEDQAALTFDESIKGCQQDGNKGSLIEFPTNSANRKDKLTAVSQFFVNISYVWIGLKKEASVGSKWKWIHSQRVETIPHLESMIMDSTWTDRCIIQLSGQWTEEKCSSKHFGRLCESSVCSLTGGECAQLCMPSVPRCRCYPGYKLFNATNCIIEDSCMDKNFCEHICTPTPKPAHCDCYPGYRMDIEEKKCIEIDLCRDLNGGCEGTCESENGTKIICSCGTGYSLHEDGKSCKQTVGFIFLFYVLPVIAVIMILVFILYKILRQWFVFEERRTAGKLARESRVSRQTKASLKVEDEEKVMAKMKEEFIEYELKKSLSTAVDPDMYNIHH